MYASFIGATWIIEQPVSSLLWRHPRVRLAMRGLRVFKHFLWMGHFGGKSPKPTHLLSNKGWVCGLSGERPTSHGPSVTTTRYIDKAGKRRCTGTKDLKPTQWKSLVALFFCLGADGGKVWHHNSSVYDSIRSYPLKFGCAFAALARDNVHPVEHQMAAAVKDCRDQMHDIFGVT